MASVGRASNEGRGLMDRLSGGDPLFGNKISGAVLGALLLAMSLNIGSSIIYTPKKPAIPGYDLPAPEAAGEGPSDQQAQAEPLPIRLASADVPKGQSAAKKCAACHTFEKGGANKIGPNLYDVIGRAKAGHPGFAFSTALKSKGGEWTFEDMDAFIANPKGYAPGTIMAFAGISNPRERADITAYLRSLADSPKPLPEATAAAAPAAPPGASQNQQQASPPMPGQRAEPGPAPLQTIPQPASPQTQPNAQQQPTPTRPPDPAQVTPPQTEPKPQ
jgi:cytochrome c